MEDKKMMEILNNKFKKVRMENIRKEQRQAKKRSAKEWKILRKLKKKKREEMQKKVYSL